jgi:hypothetical protein
MPKTASAHCFTLPRDRHEWNGRARDVPSAPCGRHASAWRGASVNALVIHPIESLGAGNVPRHPTRRPDQGPGCPPHKVKLLQKF